MVDNTTAKKQQPIMCMLLLCHDSSPAANTTFFKNSTIPNGKPLYIPFTATFSSELAYRDDLEWWTTKISLQIQIFK
jgi:hypothetical protein